MNRRHYLTLGVGAIATSAFGLGSAHAASKTLTFPAEKFFAYLKNYYDLPPPERSLFRMAYFAHADKIGLNEIAMSLNHKGKVQSLTIGLEGFISPLPSAEALREGVQLSITAPEGFNLGLSLDLLPALTPQASLSVADLVPAITQAAKSVKKAAGLMAMAMPNYDSVLFTGVRSGEVIMKDGSRKALPMKPAFTSKRGHVYPAVPYLTPAKWPQAATVQFPEAPHFILINPAPKVG